MPRKQRILSSTGCYHIVCRGIGRQILFEDASDYRYFLSQLDRFRKEIPCSIYAYCLMNNHVHLLLRIVNDVDLFMKKTGVAYAAYFNRKYQRCGHLFQNRYFSEIVENSTYLLELARYIHNNPAAAGICSRADYPWSSWQDYAKDPARKCAGIVAVDTSVVLAEAGGRDAFLAFSSEEDFLKDPFSSPRINDADAQTIIRDYLQACSSLKLQDLPRAERNRAIRDLRAKGLSVRQLERLTGIPRGIVQRAKR